MNKRPAIEQGAPNEIALGSAFELPYTSNYPIVKTALVRIRLYFSMIFRVRMEQFSFKVVVNPYTYFLTVFLIFIVMLISQVPSVIGMNKMDLATRTK